MRLSLSALMLVVTFAAMLLASIQIEGWDGLGACLLAWGLGIVVLGFFKRSKVQQITGALALSVGVCWFLVPTAVAVYHRRSLLRNLGSDDGTVRNRALRKLEYGGEDISATLAVLLEDPRESIRVFAATIIGERKYFNSLTAVGLNKALHDESAVVRGKAVRSLGQTIAATANRATTQETSLIKGILTATEDNELSVRFAASVALLQLGEEYRGIAISGIEEAIECDERQIYFEAFQCIRRASPPLIELLPALMNCIVGTDKWKKWWALDPITEFGPDAAEAVPVLVGQLQTGDLGWREHIARYLPALGKSAAPALPLLEELRDELNQEAETATDRLLYKNRAASVDESIRAIKRSMGGQ